MKGDAMQRRLVEPLYSTNAPLRRVRPPAPVLTPKETK
jgi:hypothetical protein